MKVKKPYAVAMQEILLEKGYSYVTYKDLNLLKECADRCGVKVPDLSDKLKLKRFRDRFITSFRRSGLYTMTYVRRGNILYVKFSLACYGFVECTKRDKKSKICKVNERSCSRVALIDCPYFMKFYNKANRTTKRKKVK